MRTRIQHVLNKWILTLIAIAMFLPGGFAAGGKEPVSPPNIILIFIDDMGWSDFSCFGNKDASTPNVDRMAAEGIAFEQFYVNSPICSPSRVAISTGQYPQRWNITSYLANRKLNAERGVADWLDPQAPMLARSLREAGYATGHFGKWHMGGQRDVTDALPISDYGFDASLTNFEGLGAKLLPLTIDAQGKIGRIWEGATILGDPVTWMQRSEITGGFIDAAIPFMDQAIENGKPFYINLWPDDVHAPYWPTFESYSNISEDDKRGHYHAVLEGMDRQFGKLFDYVKSNPAIRDNTIILICSDNGPALDSNGGAHLGGRAGIFKGYKTHLYEGGVRSPLIVWAPGLMEKSVIGKRNKESLFSAIDLTPSLLKLAGAAGARGVTYDGEELLDTLLGKSKESRQKPIFYSRPPDRKEFYGMKDLPDLAMRHGKWKLLCDYDGTRAQLYDIDADPSESTNLAASHPEVVTRMTRSVTNWWNSMPVLEN